MIEAVCGHANHDPLNLDVNSVKGLHIERVSIDSLQYTIDANLTYLMF